MDDLEVRDLAQALAAELSPLLVQQLLAELQQRSGLVPPVRRPALFRREGEHWTLAYGGVLVHLRDCRGLHHLARLLARPNEPVHVLELAGATTPDQPVDRGLEVLDAAAEAAYRRRLAERARTADEAERCGDLARQARAEGERAFLVQELSRVLGLGGRERRSDDRVEQARVAVTEAVHAAVSTVCRHHPALGAHLEHTVRTGTFCCYVADPAPAWEL